MTMKDYRMPHFLSPHRDENQPVAKVVKTMWVYDYLDTSFYKQGGNEVRITLEIETTYHLKEGQEMKDHLKGSVKVTARKRRVYFGEGSQDSTGIKGYSNWTPA